MDGSYTPGATLQAIREKLNHPIVDADGHLLEFPPLVRDCVRRVAGEGVARAYDDALARPHHDDGLIAPYRAFFSIPAENTLDRMTATLPSLLYQRLDQLGLDYVLLYSTMGFRFMSYPDAEVRTAVARALNTYYAEMYDGLRDRLEPVAFIPMFTPEEAVSELRHCVEVLKLKAVMMNGCIPRNTRPDGSHRFWIDTLGHDSFYDYDPVWKACEELGVVPTFHGTGKGWGTRLSDKNYVFNHLGDFATAQESVCRSLIMGGAVTRFPNLRFEFLEGGVGWAVQLINDLVSHFEKRNAVAVGQFDPKRINLDVARELFTAYSDERLRESLRGDDLSRAFGMIHGRSDDLTQYDDFAESGLQTVEDILQVFRSQLFFGCEPDDPITAMAFNQQFLPGGAALRATFGSDIGHWDCPDMSTVVVEAWEAVEKGTMTEEDFANFTFRNVASLVTHLNPEFFDGTVVESALPARSP
jgi:predicted TIM-barrel fold metal-dependent hydrolase